MAKKREIRNSTAEFLTFVAEGRENGIQVLYKNETNWATQKAMAALFNVGTPAINKHLTNIFSEGELKKEATVSKMEIVQTEGNREVKRMMELYNLDAIISVGYRVNSHRGVQFRQWATRVLKEYMIKGFALNDDLLKNAGQGNYFDELLTRIRDIRSSEKVFYRKVLEIYALSIDYDPRTSITQQFFKTVQNKMHFAAHGHTAAEVIYDRANAKRISWV